MSRRRRWIGIVIAVLVAAFIVQYVRGVDYDELSGQSASIPWIVAASAIALGARYWGVIVWRTIMRDLGAERLPNFATLASVYSRAWLGRYVPGKVTWIAGKVYFGSNHGLSKSKLAVSSVLEAQVQIVLYVVLSLGLLGTTGRLDRLDGGSRWLLVLGAGALALSVIPQVFNRGLRLLDRLIGGRLEEGTEVSGRLVGTAVALHSFGFLVSGGSYAALTSAFTGLDVADALFTVAVFNLAGAVGVLALIAPSGLGVREGVQLLLLPSIMLNSTALVVTVAARLWSVAIDLTFYAIANVTTALRRQEGR